MKCRTFLKIPDSLYRLLKKMDFDDSSCISKFYEKVKEPGDKTNTEAFSFTGCNYGSCSNNSI